METVVVMSESLVVASDFDETVTEVLPQVVLLQENLMCIEVFLLGETGRRDVDGGAGGSYPGVVGSGCC